MSGDNEHGSEIARLLQRISAEYEAARRGLTGPAQGTSQHQFITQRMERMHELHAQLHTLVGEKAMTLIATQLDQADQDAADNSLLKGNRR